MQFSGVPVGVEMDERSSEVDRASFTKNALGVSGYGAKPWQIQNVGKPQDSGP